MSICLSESKNNWRFPISFIFQCQHEVSWKFCLFTFWGRLSRPHNVRKMSAGGKIVYPKCKEPLWHKKRGTNVSNPFKPQYSPIGNCPNSFFSNSGITKSLKLSYNLTFPHIQPSYYWPSRHPMKSRKNALPSAKVKLANEVFFTPSQLRIFKSSF